MAGKLFKIPFAIAGDKTAIPDALQPSGAVSYTEGFSPDYELVDTDPNYKPVPRNETNQIYFDITESVGIIQQQGFADWDAAAAPYVINSFVRHANEVWFSPVAANSTIPGDASTTWLPVEPSTIAAVTMTGSNVTLTPLQHGKKVIVITGALTANLNLVFPAIVGSWTILNSTTGNFSITAKTPSGTGTRVFKKIGIFCDGINIYPDYDFSSGLFGTTNRQDLPSGLVLQSGQSATTTGGVCFITFPQAFTNNYQIFAMHSGLGQASFVEDFTEHGLGGTKLLGFNGTSPMVSGAIVYWFAIGI